MSHSAIPKVVLLGRPNVGKSTLFNRLIRSNRAITHDRPGITRDRMEGIVRSREDVDFLLVDTGGITLDGHARVEQGPEGIRGFEEAILKQAKEAMHEADILCLVMDAREGLTPYDKHLADFLRRLGKPLMLAVNKVDGPEKADILLAEFHELGFDMLPCSAAHGFNVRCLEDALRERLLEARTTQAGTAIAGNALVLPSDAGMGEAAIFSEGDSPLRLCLLGRPNAGKSSLVNALVGETRMIVSDVSGTTRDSVDVEARIDGSVCVFVDTAGVRRRSRIADLVERYSVNSSLKSTTKAHVTLLVLDAAEGLTVQDKRLLSLLHDRKTPFMLLVNKSDLLVSEKRGEMPELYRDALAFCPHVPILFVSAKNGYNLRKVVPLARAIRRECAVRVSTGQLNRALSDIVARHHPPVVGQARAKFFYITQAESRPPTFIFFVNSAERIAPSYARYLERSLRAVFGIRHAPVRVHFRSSHGKKLERS
ncbi:MAG: ribosome biogenesis GTPase Der [Desulfovibrio sp.]|jgi:GTP-binding protein|nr:ribosome biogenesis GTPase Der [Desulfovibrio sp.]